MTRFRDRPRETRISILVGLLTAVLVLVGGVAFALTQKTTWTAESVVVVLPSAKLDAADSAAYYETLSRGQIVATFAEVADNLRFEQQAEDHLQLNPAQRASVTTTVSVVPDTSVILVQTKAADPALAEQVADGTTSLASSYLSGLSRPYRTDVVHHAQGSAFSSGTSPTLLAALSVLVALIAGVAVQQALYHLLTALRPPRRRALPDVERLLGPTSSTPAEAPREQPVGSWW